MYGKSLFKALPMLLIALSVLAVQGCSQGGPSPVPESFGNEPEPGNGDIHQPEEKGMFLMHDTLCAGCHTDNMDGTFSGIAPFDVNDLQRTTMETLADYIEDEMPRSNPEICDSECADNITAYLAAYYVPGGNETPLSRGQTLMEGEMCAGCHADNGDGTFGKPGGRTFYDVNYLRMAESESDLAAYLEASMPPGDNAVNCEGECATDLAAYLWSLRTELEEPDTRVRGQALMEGDMCGGCHADNNDGTFGNEGGHAFFDVNALRLANTEAALATYLHESMPPGDSSVNCEGRCATDLANYLWSLRADAEQPDPIAQGKVLMEGEMCAGCHADNGDGTFGKPGARTFYDVSYLRMADSESELAAYLEVSMPPGDNAVNCEGECATDLAAYLWSLRTELEEPDTLVRGQALMEGDMCGGCHADNNDGTFGNEGGHAFFDVNALQLADSEASLATYLHDSMPPEDNSVNCEGRCATDLANYLWSLRADLSGGTSGDGSSSSSSSSSTSSTSSSSSSGSSIGEGSSSNSSSGGATDSDDAIERGRLQLMSAECSECHTDMGDGEFAGAFNSFADIKSENEQALAQYIEETMPPNNIGSCVGACAADTAAYLWSFSDQVPDGGSSSTSSSSSSSSTSSSSSASSGSSSSSSSTGSTNSSTSSSSSTSSTGSSSSSTGSSSSGGVEEPFTPAELGASIMSGDMCINCHVNNGDDGTFGGDPGSFGYFDMNQLVHAESETELVSYLETAMPPSEPAICDRECATQVTAYLWTFYDEEQAAANDEAAQAMAISRGEALMTEGALCAGCHGDNGNGTFGAGEKTYFDPDSMRNADTEQSLAIYIDESMPMDPAACVGECATDIAAYLWSLRDEVAIPFGDAAQ